MKKNNDTFPNEEVDRINWREWNNIYNNISLCWGFGSGFWALSVVFILMSFGIIG
jgi:CRISPR/Cas system CSM-associated protein Csm5 (group 7 of RAMP superfamily)